MSTTYIPLRLKLCYVSVLLTVFVPLLQVIVDGIILSESDSEDSYSDNEGTLDIDDKDFVLHHSDSDIDQTFKELSPRVLNFVEGSTPAGEEEKTKQAKDTGDNAFVDEFLSSPTSVKIETEAQCYAHGYELAEKTDSRSYARIHRGHVMECKLKTHAKMHEMVLSVGHEMVSRCALLCQYMYTICVAA